MGKVATSGSEIAARMHVNMAPTLLFLRRGEVEERIVGLRSKAEIAARLDRILPA